MSSFNENENRNLKTNVSLSKTAVQKIRKAIRYWYGSLSVGELALNKALVNEIEKLERLLMGQMVAR